LRLGDYSNETLKNRLAPQAHIICARYAAAGITMAFVDSGNWVEPGDILLYSDL